MKEIISQIVDDSLTDKDELRRELKNIIADPQQVRSWEAYHFLGDALRHGNAASLGNIGNGGLADKVFSKISDLPTRSERSSIPRVEKKLRKHTYRDYLALAASATFAALILWNVADLDQGGELIAEQQPIQNHHTEIMLQEILASHSNASVAMNGISSYTRLVSINHN